MWIATVLTRLPATYRISLFLSLYLSTPSHDMAVGRGFAKIGRLAQGGAKNSVGLVAGVASWLVGQNNDDDDSDSDSKVNFTQVQNGLREALTKKQRV